MLRMRGAGAQVVAGCTIKQAGESVTPDNMRLMAIKGHHIGNAERTTMFKYDAPRQILKLCQTLTAALGFCVPGLQAFLPHLAAALGFGYLVKFAQ